MLDSYGKRTSFLAGSGARYEFCGMLLLLLITAASGDPVTMAGSNTSPPVYADTISQHDTRMGMQGSEGMARNRSAEHASRAAVDGMNPFRDAAAYARMGSMRFDAGIGLGPGESTHARMGRSLAGGTKHDDLASHASRAIETKATSQIRTPLRENAPQHTTSTSPPIKRLQFFLMVFYLCAWVATIAMMQPGNARDPPHWNPDTGHTTFERWSREVYLWSIGSEMDPRRKAAHVVRALGGSAKEYALRLPPNIFTAGGVIGGRNVDPMSSLMHMLAQHFAPLNEEVQMAASTELERFRRQPRERVDALLTRFESIRDRAASHGNLVLTPALAATKLVEAVGVDSTQLWDLLRPTNGVWPQTEDEYRAMTQTLRRMGHILERSQGNIAGLLRGNSQNSMQNWMVDPGDGSQPQEDPWHSTAGDPWANAGHQHH